MIQMRIEIEEEELPTLFVRVWSLMGSIKAHRDELVRKDGILYNYITQNGIRFGYHTTPDYVVFTVGDDIFEVGRSGLYKGSSMELTMFPKDKVFGELMEFVDDYWGRD